MDVLLISIFSIVIGSFILYWVIKNAINNSEVAKKMKWMELHLAELKLQVKEMNKK